MKNYIVAEIFWSAQGEGYRAGIPSVFLRMAGCSLKCDYCDTKYSWKNGTVLSIDEILSRIQEFIKINPGILQVVITGGEPLEQDISSVVDSLREKNIFVSIETNGIHDLKTDIDWLTVSPKDVSGFKVNRKLSEKINEMKLIANENLTVEIVKKFSSLKKNFPIFLQPQQYDSKRFENTFKLYAECVKEGIRDVRLGFQMQNFYEIR